TTDSVTNGPARSGTELLIRELRQTWDENDVQELRRLLSLLTPPFDQVNDFQVRLETDVDPSCSGVVASPLMAAAAIEGDFTLATNGNIDVRLIHRASTGTRRRVETRSNTSFEQLIHPKPKPGSTQSPSDTVKKLGPVSARLLFYPQKAETVRGLDLG